jgi:peptidoglycan-associated lipoprotein
MHASRKTAPSALLATLLAALVAALLGACSSTPIAPQAPVAKAPAMAPVAAAAPMPMAAAPQPASREVKTVTVPAYLDPKSDIANARSVYFDFDAAAVKPEFETTIERNARFLATHSGVAIRIEGNTDERGGAEYNLALGQKRAEAVRRQLALLGVKETQMEAVSWGEGKPKAAGHDESAWAQNRRADLHYPSN